MFHVEQQMVRFLNTTSVLGQTLREKMPQARFGQGPVPPTLSSYSAG